MMEARARENVRFVPPARAGEGLPDSVKSDFARTSSDDVWLTRLFVVAGLGLVATLLVALVLLGRVIPIPVHPPATGMGRAEVPVGCCTATP